MGELGTAISINNLSFSYTENVVLQDTSIDIEASRFTVILGKNGSGKSTLLRIVAGLLPCKKGEILINGNDLHHLNLTNRARLFGFLGQKHKAVFPFTVNQVVLTGRSGYINFVPKVKDVEISMEAMLKTGILHLKDHIYTELSGGEQQLVMIGRVLAQEPKILLLDEPTTHLDFSNQIKLMTLLRELTENKLTVVAVLHDPNIAFLYGDDFIFVRNGKLIRPEAPANPWDAEFLETIYENKLQSIPYSGKALIVPRLNENENA